MPKKQPGKRPARRRRSTPKQPETKPVTEENWDLQKINQKPPTPQCLCCPDCWNVPCDTCQAGDVCQMIPCACGTIYAKK